MGSETRSQLWHTAAVQTLILTCVLLSQRPVPHPLPAPKDGGLVLLKSMVYPPIRDLQPVKWESHTFHTHKLWIVDSRARAVRELVVAHHILALDFRHYLCETHRDSRTWSRKNDENRVVLLPPATYKRKIFDGTGREAAEGLKHTNFRQFHHCGRSAVSDYVSFVNVTFQGRPGSIRSKLHLWRVLEEIGALGHYDRGLFASNIQAYQVTDGELLPRALPQRTDAAPPCHPHGPRESPVLSPQIDSNSLVAPSETRGFAGDLAEKNVSVSTSTRSSVNDSLASVFCGSDHPPWSMMGPRCVSLLDHPNDMLSHQGENSGGFSLWEMMETDLAEAEGMVKLEYDNDATGVKSAEMEDDPIWSDSSERATTRPDDFIAGDGSVMCCEEQEVFEQESHTDETASPCCSYEVPNGRLLHMYYDTEALESSLSREMQMNSRGSNVREEYDVIDFVDYDDCDEGPGNPGGDSSPLDSDATASLSDAVSGQSGLVSAETVASDTDLTEEDAEVIEILWKQDCDLGLTRGDFAPVLPVQEDAVPEKLARLGQEWCPESCKLEVPSAEAPEDTFEDIWAGLDYTVDSETGEYVLRMPPSGATDAAPTVPSSVENLNATGDPLMAAPIPTTIADLVTTDQPVAAPTAQESTSRARRLTHSSDSGRESLDDSDSGEGEIDRLNEMIDAARNQTGATQPAQPFLRMVSIEERWQDLASILRLSEQPGSAAAAAAAAVQTPQPQPVFTAHSPNQTRFPASSVAAPTQLASPVASSPAAAEPGLPSPPESQPQYYQLAAMVAPPAAAGLSPLDQESTFLSQLLGVDDLDIVAESAAPEFWMSSQSAQPTLPTVENVSSSAPQLQELGPLAAATTASGTPSAPEGGPHRRQPPAAQKKHQMFGKRMFNGQQQDDYESRSPGGSSSGEQQPTPASPVRQRYGAEAGVHGVYPGAHVPAPGEAAALASPVEPKYSGTAEFAAATAQHRLSPVAHNHSYQQPSPAEGLSDTRRPVARDKGQRLSRDERRTREMNIPMTPEEIVHLPMDEFNERLSKMQLTEAQLSLVRDVRRRGKNKMAAQNCRKRKLDQIQTLADNLQKVRDQRRRDLADNQRLASERARIRDKYAQLHRHVFQSLRDEEGRPYSASQYSLQLSADGDVLLVPRGTARGAAFVPPDPSTGARRKQQCE